MEQSDHAAPQMLFDRVALLSGRPVYWTVQPDDALKHAKRIGGLLQWCLRLPDVQLGIDPKGMGLIVRSVYYQQGKTFSSDEDRWLDRVGAREAEVVPWPTDPERFGDQATLSLSHLERAADASGDYVWISHAEATDWASKSGACLEEYGSLFAADTRTEAPFRRTRGETAGLLLCSPTLTTLPVRGIFIPGSRSPAHISAHVPGLRRPHIGGSGP